MSLNLFLRSLPAFKATKSLESKNYRERFAATSSDSGQGKLWNPKLISDITLGLTALASLMYGTGLSNVILRDLCW